MLKKRFFFVSGLRRTAVTDSRRGDELQMENARIAEIFDTIADLLELGQGNPFKVRSYRNAARTVGDMSRNLGEMASRGEDLTQLPSIGTALARKIKEIVDTGTCKRLEELQRQGQEELRNLLRIPGLGPRKVALLHKKLGIRTLEDLMQAAKDHRIKDIPGMGRKSERNILEAIAKIGESPNRVSYHVARDYVQSLEKKLDSIGTMKHWEIAGSFRRGSETVGDLDLVVQAEDRSAAQDAFLDYDSIDQLIGRGPEKMSVRLKGGLQVDLRFFEPESYGAALTYFTGSKPHNIALRKRAQDRGWKLNEYGIFKQNRLLAGSTEESVYHRLNLPWIHPELREDRGELEAAERGELPNLIELADIQGDLHCHTKITDGRNTLEEMVQATIEKGYSYLAITEHSKAVRIAKGLNEKALRKHMDCIREMNDSLKDLWLLAGVEVDILKTGKLDLDEKVLAELDWVVASVHSAFNLEKEKMTDRLLAAIRTGVVHCIGHPLTRLIGRRDQISLDLDKIFEACRDHGVFLEINGSPERLDLPDIHCKRAKEAGVKFVIVTDAHGTAELDFMRYGVITARRGWLEKEDVVNTFSTQRLRTTLRRK